MTVQRLADWGPISPDSAMPGYTGPSTDTVVDQDDPTKFFTLDYYEQQIVQFQATLINLDQTAQVIADTIPTLDPTADAAVLSQYQQWLNDYHNKKTEIQATAKAVNGIVTTVNAFGVGLPNVTLPQTLSQWQPIAVVGVAAAVAAAASIVAWAAQQIVTAQNITAQIQSLPADQRAAALAKLQQPSTLASISNVVKWVAIGLLVWFGWQAWQDYSSHRHATAMEADD
jgi:hypothetical protein